ncbi:MAG: serine hydrolase domain-containing protein [Gemmatimonadales bacterium]
MIRAAAALAALIAFPLAGGGLPAQTGDALAARVDSLLSPWNRRDTPGCALGIDRAGEPLLRRAVGMANLESAAPWTVETLSESGSVAKQFTAAALVLLALDGKLRLDDEAIRWVPEVAGVGRRITIRHLLTHTSGLPDRYTLHEVEGRPAGEVDHPNTEVIDVVSRLRRLNFDPGEDYLYSNTGYIVAATIIERVSGRTLQQFTEERIFRPLGMSRTRWREDHRVVVPGRAAAYSGALERGFRNDHPFTRVIGSGGLLTTVDDFLRWQAALQRGPAPWGAVRDSIERVGRLNDGTLLTYGLGVTADTWRGVRSVSHSGSTGGYRAALARYPSQEVAVALLCNLGTIEPGGLARDLAAAVLGDALAAAPAPPRPIAVDSAELASLAGVYHSPRTEEVLVLRHGTGGLLFGRTGNRALISIAPGRFRHPQAEVFFTVWRVENGPPLRLVVEPANGREVEYLRVDPPLSSPAELAAYAGTYRSSELGAELRLAVERDTLRLLRGWRTSQALVPVYRDGFALPGQEYLRFTRGRGGRPDGFVLWAGRVRNLRFERVPEAALGSSGRR